MSDGASPFPDDFAEYQAARLGNAKPSDAGAEEPAAETVSDSETDQDPEQGEYEAGEDDEEEDEEDEDEEDEPAKPKGKKSGFQKRLQKFKAREAGLVAEIERLKSAAGQPATTAQPQPVATDANGKPVRPKLEEFDTYEAHEIALKEYEERLVDWKLAKHLEKQTEDQRKAAAAKAWEDRVSKVREKDPAYDKKIDAARFPNTPAVPEVRTAIAESEVGPDILLYLCENPAEAKRILTLSPNRAAVEVGKIEARFLSAPAPKRNKVTSAPEPYTPVNGRGTPPPKSLYDVTNFSEYEARRLAGAKS